MMANYNTELEIHEQVLPSLYEFLKILATREDFLHQAKLAFGNQFSTKNLERLRQQWLVGNFTGLPPIEVRSFSELDEPYKPFAAGDDAIYVSREYLEQYTSHLPVIANPIFEKLRRFDIRTIDGTHNNGNKGAADSQLLRLFDNAYKDGHNTPRGGYFSDSTLPNPRMISNIVVNQTHSITNFLGASDWLWQWGQFVDHDLDLNEAVPMPPEEDKTPIPVPDDDPIFEAGTRLPFIRVTAAEGTGTSLKNPRETLNHITAFLDASNVYGSDPERAEFLRDRTAGRGLLKTSLDYSGSEVLLPLNDGTQSNATGGRLGDLQFVGGDVRANEQLGLTAVHALFVREHNRIATNLSERLSSGEFELNALFAAYASKHSGLSHAALIDDFVYEAARKVVIAEVQAITYNEFLPVLIGEGTLARYKGYKANINPQISTEFANAAYRLGHSLLNNQIRRMDTNGVDHIKLQDAFFRPEYIQEHGIEPILTGLIFQGAQELDHHLVDSVRNLLFPAGTGGVDLAAVNIARGREVGLPSYTEVYEQIFDTPIHEFSDLGSQGLGLMNDAVVHLLETAYDSVDQIDLWLGGLSELPGQHGGLLGPTLSYFIADQFARTRDGDQYFYLQKEELGQLEILAPGIKHVTLSDILRQNSHNNYLIPENVFEVPFEHTLFGDELDDVLRGRRQDTLIDGRGGHDRLLGLAGDDYLFGGTGNDSIWGRSGHDKAFGGDGDDLLLGHAGRDILVGGAGNDRLLGGRHSDILDGQSGNDTMVGGAGRDVIVYKADILNDGYFDLDIIRQLQIGDRLDFNHYLGAGGHITFERVSRHQLQIDLSGEDQINVFGSRSALNATEHQLRSI